MILRRLPLTAAALALGLGLAPAHAEPQKFELDPAHTTVAFLVMHVGYAKTLGVFREVSGSFVYDAEAQTLSDLEVTVNPASVWTNNDRRDEHVRDDDFLDVEDHAKITFTATDAEVTGERSGTVTGDLTVLGTTRPVTLEVTLNKDAVYPFGHEKRTVGVSARGSVMRSDFGMDYAVANGLVGDEVELIVEMEAIAAD